MINQENNAGGIHFNTPAEEMGAGGIVFNEPEQAVIDGDHLPTGTGEVSTKALFEYVRANHGSDLHIAPNSPPKIRLYGEIFLIPGYENLTEENVFSLIYETMDEETKKEFTAENDIDYSYVDPEKKRYRCNAMMSLAGPAGVFRLITDNIKSFEELGLPESAKRIKALRKGLVLVTGPAGCGKSTTLATLVDMINTEHDGHILTIEDPVEVLHKSKKALVNHREVGRHTNSFYRALKSALREDPDVIMIGEMRDLETISLALTAAETGHLVFGTLHTSSAHKTITRIIDVFPTGKKQQIITMLSESVQCVISQVLCKKKNEPGQVPAFEIMFGTPAIRNLIRTNKIFQIPSAVSVGMREGMHTLDQALEKLVKEGKISAEEAKKHAHNPRDLNI